MPEQTQEEIFRYYFLRQPQRVNGVHGVNFYCSKVHRKVNAEVEE